LAKKVISQVRFEISQIDELLKSYSDILHKIGKDAPNLIELTAFASILHSFYNGLENIFLCIVKRIDINVPIGDRWHRDLLNQMGKATLERNQVLSNKTIDKLVDYMGFRHFYRHSYSFSLEWEELERLIVPIENIWQQVKNELEIFLNSLEINNEM
jgi:hypothetical protein